MVNNCFVYPSKYFSKYYMDLHRPTKIYSIIWYIFHITACVPTSFFTSQYDIKITFFNFTIKIMVGICHYVLPNLWFMNISVITFFSIINIVATDVPVPGHSSASLRWSSEGKLLNHKV